MAAAALVAHQHQGRDDPAKRKGYTGMTSMNTLRGPAPQAKHSPGRTGSMLSQDGRRPSAMLVDSSSAGLSNTGTTTAVASSESEAQEGEGSPAEAAPLHPSDRGRHFANGGQLPSRCQLTTGAVSRPLFRWVVANR